MEPRARRRWRKVLFRTGLILVSVVVVSVASIGVYAGITVTELNNGVARTDVIVQETSEPGQPPRAKPADGATDILLVGSDSRTDAQGRPLPKRMLEELRVSSNDGELTDALILVRVPNDGRKAVGFSFPRDSFVDIAGGFGHHKINSAFSRGRLAAARAMRSEGKHDAVKIEKDSTSAGRRTIVRTVEQLTGVTVDHYAEVNLLGFYEIAKAVGGVEVCLKQATSEEKSGADFKAGRQLVTGADALAFVRQRGGLPRGDLDRVVRQQAFMTGLVKKVMSAEVLANPTRLSALTESIKNSLVLDKDWNIVGFAREMHGLTAGNVRFTTIPVGRTDLPTNGDGIAVEVDPKRVRAAAAEVTGLPPRAELDGKRNPIPTTQTPPGPEHPRSAAPQAGQAPKTLPELTAETSTVDSVAPGKVESSPTPTTGETVNASDIPCVN